MKFFSFIRQLIYRMFPFSRKVRSQSPSSTSRKTTSTSHTPLHFHKADKEVSHPVSSQKSLQEDPLVHKRGQLPVEGSKLMVEHHQGIEGSSPEAGLKHQKEDPPVTGPSPDLEEKANLESDHSDQSFEALIAESVNLNQEIQYDVPEALALIATNGEVTANRECQEDASVYMGQAGMSAETLELTTDTQSQPALADSGANKSASGSFGEAEAIEMAHEAIRWELENSNLDLREQIEFDVVVDEDHKDNPAGPDLDSDGLDEETIPRDDWEPYHRVSEVGESGEEIENLKELDAVVDGVNLELSIQETYSRHTQSDHSVDIGLSDEQVAGQPVQAQPGPAEENLSPVPFAPIDGTHVESQHDLSPKDERPACLFERLVLRPEMLGVDDQEIDDFLKKLEANDSEDLLHLKLPKLEEFFLKSLERFDYIGELPISGQFFKEFIEYLKEESEFRGRPDPRHSLPTLFVISMVFFARYSETESRAFWGPYAKEVWDREELQYFGNINRRLFEYSRHYLGDMAGLSFDATSRGDVVRPVYQHAIIPSYLQENFAEWLVGNFASLMHYSVDQLQRVLVTEKSLNYVYPRLRNFIRDADTQEAAARLVSRMTDAIVLFNEEESGASVEKFLSSNLEQSLWRVIYRKLTEDPEGIATLRKVSPQLTWRWSEEKGLHLHLANVRSPEAIRPHMIIWAHPDDQNIKTRNQGERVYPGRIRTDRIWELEPKDIRVRGPLNGRVILLSEEYDLDQARKEQEDKIILERVIPSLPENVLFFRLRDKRDAAVLRDSFDADGTWIIFSQKGIRLEDISGQAIIGTSVIIPPALLELGFTHATKVCLTLPVVLASHNQRYDKPIDKVELNPTLFGHHKLQGMPKDLPPIFSSAEVKLEMTCSPDSRSFKRYILRIRQNGRQRRSHYLTDLMKEGLLKKTDQTCLLDLAPFISDPGHYTLDLRHNLKSMLDEPLQFAWLPDAVCIHEPDLDICYSPHNPLRISIGGVSSEQVQPYDNEKYKKTQVEHQVELTWPMLKGKRCRFDIYWEDYPIHFGWDIDRVAAWIEGVGDAEHVWEGEEGKVSLRVLGNSRERYSLHVEGLDRSREEYLNAKGEYEEQLLETVLRDMLLVSNRAQSLVTIKMRNDEWRLFDYLKKPDIQIKGVTYAEPRLRVGLDYSRSLEGNYTFQIRNRDHRVSVETIAEIHSLDTDMNLLAPDLVAGTYILEIAMDGSILAASQAFRVIEPVMGSRAQEDQIVHELSTDRKQILLQTLTSLQAHVFSWVDASYGIDSLLEHLEKIHEKNDLSKNMRLGEGDIEENATRFLPTWAVLSHPINFETKPHRRILHVYPEQAWHRGLFGKGYVDLKILGDRIRVAVYWKPTNDKESLRLWMRVSPDTVQGPIGEIDPSDLDPVYLCKHCGEALGAKKGSYIFLPPSVVQLHQHGDESTPLRERLVDTVYPWKDEPLEASFTQNFDARLISTYQIEKTITPNYLQSLIEGVVQPEEDDMELSVPVYWQDAFDFQVAVSELYRKLGQEEIMRLEGYSRALEPVFAYFADKEDLIPAYAAVLRMLDILDEREHPYNIPRHILLLAMALRTKAHKPIRFKMLMRETELTERELMSLIDLALANCPKLFEWSIAWAELLFLHAGS